MQILLDGQHAENFNPDTTIDKWYNSGFRARRATKNEEIESILEITAIQLPNEEE